VTGNQIGNKLQLTTKITNNLLTKNKTKPQ